MEKELQSLENNRIREAWNYLYFQEGIIKRLMDSAYNKSLKTK